jgi:predicted dehydrogenase
MNQPNQPTRREFLKTSTAATLLAGFPAVLSGAPTSEKLKLGLIGCGGRGTGAASQALTADSNMELTAIGDAFADRLELGLKSLEAAQPGRINLKPQNKFVGLDAYQKVIHSGIDVVVLAAPGGFRSRHLREAVEAGKHIFCEKPMAVDGPGIRSVIESVEIAKKKGLALRAGFCFRWDNALQETYKRVLDGDIGDIVTIYSTRLGGPLTSKYPGTRAPGMTDLEWQLRNWGAFLWTSGDYMMEVSVHSVDKIAWAMRDVPPVRCVATGGRQIAHYGNIYDHFDITWEYEDGRRTILKTKYQEPAYKEHADYFYGTEGRCIIGRKTVPEITGKKPWRFTGPKGGDMYQNEHDSLFASIRAGRPTNDGDWMWKSCLTAIMGRMSAYTGREITWEMALNSKEDLFPKNLSWDMKLNVPPIAEPGKTKFV